MIDLKAKLDAHTDDDRMVLDAARSYCSRDPELRRVRALRGQLPSHDPLAWQEMAQMGWLGCRTPEEHGGTPLSLAQLCLLLEQHGGSLAPEPLSAAVVLAGGVLAASDNQALKAQWLARVADGRWLPSLAWQDRPALGRTTAAGTRARAQDGGYFLNGAKAFVSHGETAQAFLVSSQTENGMGLFLVDRQASGLSVTPHHRVDGGTWTELSLADVRVEPDAVIALGEVADNALARALDEARLAVSAELVGLMSRLFEITVDYVTMREQFGRPVGSFQALQHRAVDTLVQVEMARAVLRQAAAGFDASDDPATRARLASQVKARCSDAALKVSKACVQMHGGIAYTDECNVGLFLKRAMVLSAWLGGPGEHRQRYGRLLQEGSEPSAEAREDDDPLIRKARQLLAEHFPAEWRFPTTRMSQAQTEPWQRALGQHGWAAPGWPKEFGGMGLSAWDQIRVLDEFSNAGVSTVSNMGVTMLGPLLIRYGTPAQREKHLPGILSGETRWCQGYSEPGAGSDLAGLRTTAVLQGDHFVVNGQKIWTTYAHEAHWIFLLVRTDPKAKKQQGISFLLVDMKSPGITVKRIRNLTGESEFCEVFFDNVQVPAAHIVGELNRGWTMAKSLLGSERIMIGSPRLARYPLQLLRDLLKAQGRFDDPVIRVRYDELQLDVDDLGAFFVRMAEVLRRGEELGPEVSMLKLWVSETMQRVTDLMLEAGGQQATLDEAIPLDDSHSVHIAGHYFMSRPATIYGGSSEIQRNILARGVLELPD